MAWPIARGAAVAPPRLPVRRVGPVHWLGVFTLLRREVLAALRWWPETVFGPVVSTLLYVAVFAAALGPDFASIEGAAAFDFILPGVIAFAVMSRSLENTLFAILFDKIEGTISDTLMPPLSPAEWVAGYALSGLLGGTVTGGLIIAVVVPLTGMPIHDPLLVVVFGAATAVLLALIGILVAIFCEKWDQAAAFQGFVFVPLAFLSGVFAPIDRLPDALAGLLRVNPLYFAVDGFRGAAIGIHAEPLWLSLGVVAVAITAASGLSLYLVGSGYKLRP